MRSWYVLPQAVLLTAILHVAPVHAQEASPAAALAAAKMDRAKELLVIEENLKRGEAVRAQIALEIAEVEKNRAALEADLVATNARVRQAEDRISEARIRLQAALTSEDALTRTLASRQDMIADILATLQRIGRRPPPAVVVQPGDILSAVRASIQLGAVLPDMRAEAEQLARDVEALAAARATKVKEQDTLEAERRAVMSDQDRLTQLIAARQKDIAFRQRKLEQESVKSQALAAQAESLKDLISRLEADDAATRMAEEASRLVPPAADEKVEEGPKTRLSPKVPFESLKSSLPLPVAGEVVKTFGSPDGLGGIERGVTISTPASAIVTAPADATVAFAEPFRSYGTVLILNGGSGYHLVFIGMESANVRVGQFVLAGEPIGVMGREGRPVGTDDTTASVSQAGGADAAAPLLYVEMRKDSAPIDSRSWWARTDKAKDGG